MWFVAPLSWLGKAVLGAVGFTSTGVAAGSTAAAMQAGIGNVAAGSAFAALQSAGAASAGGAVTTGIGAGVAIAGTAALSERRQHQRSRL